MNENENDKTTKLFSPQNRYKPTKEQQLKALEWAINDDVHPLRNEVLAYIHQQISKRRS